MKKYEIKIRGAVPVLFNRFSYELNKEKSSINKEKIPEWEENNYKRKAHLDKNDNVLLPEDYILGCLRNAAFKSGVQIAKQKGKKGISKKFVDSNLLVLESTPVAHKSDIKPFVNYVVISRQKVMSHRPLIEEWSCKIKMADLNEMFSKDELFSLFEYAGQFVGVGDWIPRYGRFITESVKEVD